MLRMFLVIIPLAFISGWLYYHPGILMIEVNPYVINTSLWVGFLALILFYIVIRLLLWLIWLPKTFSSRHRLNRFKKIVTKLDYQLSSIASGRLRSLQWKLDSKQSPLEVICVMLTRCAQKTFDHQLLSQAIVSHPRDELTLRWIAALYFMHQNQHSRALDELKSAMVIDSTHLWLNDSLAEVYAKLKEWDTLYEHLQSSKKYMTRSVYDDYIDHATFHTLAGLVNEPEHFNKVYRQLTREQVSDERYQDLLCQMYLASQNNQAAKKMIERKLYYSFDQEYVKIYMSIPTIKDDELLKQLKYWHGKYPKEVIISKEMNRVAHRLQQFDLAVQSAEQMIQFDPSLEHLTQALLTFRAHAPEKTKAVLEKMSKTIDSIS